MTFQAGSIVLEVLILLTQIHLLSWDPEGVATKSLSHVYNMGISHTQYALMG